MKKCPFCKAEIEENASFCLYCMSELEEKHIIIAKKNSNRILISGICILAILIVSILFFLFSDRSGENESSIPSYTETIEDNSEPNSYTSEYETLENTENDITEYESSVAESESESNTSDIVSNETTVDINIDTSEETILDHSSQTSTSTNLENNESEENIIVEDSSVEDTSIEDSSVEDSSTESNYENNESTSQTNQEIKYKYRNSVHGDEVNGYGISASYIENGITIIGVETVSENGVYVIPETIDGKKVIAIASNAFCEEHIKNTVKKVVVPKTVVGIQNYAFSDCYNMIDLYIQGESVAGWPDLFFPTLEKANGTITLHASKTCNDRNFNTFASVYSYYALTCGYELVWKFEEWDGLL